MRKSISRSESFDQKIDAKLVGGKIRKRNRSPSYVAGNVGSRIGSTRNLTEEDKWLKIKSSQSNEVLSNNSTRRNHTPERSSNNNTSNHQRFIQNTPDSKVAARLASNDCLQYDA